MTWAHGLDASDLARIEVERADDPIVHALLRHIAKLSEELESSDVEDVAEDVEELEDEVASLERENAELREKLDRVRSFL